MDYQYRGGNNLSSEINTGIAKVRKRANEKKRQKAGFKPIRAKFNGYCKKCERGIREGDLILRSTDYWYHAYGCPVSENLRLDK